MREERMEKIIEKITHLARRKTKKVNIEEVKYNFEKMEKYKFLNLKKMLEEAGFKKIFKSMP